MITYQVPLETYPDTYNGKPLAYAGVASQKNYVSVYLMAIYMDDETQRRFGRPTGRRASATTWASRACASESWTICRWSYLGRRRIGRRRGVHRACGASAPPVQGKAGLSGLVGATLRVTFGRLCVLRRSAAKHRVAITPDCILISADIGTRSLGTDIALEVGCGEAVRVTRVDAGRTSRQVVIIGRGVHEQGIGCQVMRAFGDARISAA